MGKFRWALVFAVILPLIMFLSSNAYSIPKLINYQGRLADSSGNPVSSDTSVTFTIYNAPSGGTPLWTETQTVSFNPQGIFSVQLGKQTPLAMEIFDEDDLYLGIKVGADPEMSPRQQLASVPFAFRANQAPTVPTIIAVNSVWAGASFLPELHVYFNEATDEEGIYTYYFFRDGDYMEGVGIDDTVLTAPGERKLVDGALPELTTYCYEIAALNISNIRSARSSAVCKQSGGFRDNGNGTITMQGLGLMWQQYEGNTYNWYQASGMYDGTYNPDTLDVCGSLALGGYDDWRLPTSTELGVRFIDWNNSPLCRPIFNCAWDYYWTSEDLGIEAYAVDFLSGSGNTLSKTDINYVRCVRDVPE